MGRGLASDEARKKAVLSSNVSLPHPTPSSVKVVNAESRVKSTFINLLESSESFCSTLFPLLTAAPARVA